MTFDYARADDALQAQLRGEPLPSEPDVYGRDHSMGCIISACNDAARRLDTYRPEWRKLGAVWDVPRGVDRKLAAALRAIEALRELASAERDAGTKCECKGCVRR